MPLEIMEMNDNHSTGYSMFGYLCAYMRCYYPLEFCTAYLNCSESPTDIQQGTQLAIDKGFSIYSPKFRKSKGEFFMDKSNNAIYKGVGSIKGFNKEVADKLYDLRDKKFETFYDLMVLFKEIGLNKSQLDTLIKIDYFAEFGDINYLLMYTDIYNKYGKRKTIPKPLPIDIDLTGCFGKETAKQYSQIDNRAIVNRFMDYMVNIPKITIYDKMKYQNEFLGYTDMTLDCEPNIFMVQGLDINRYGTPFVTLYRCCDSKVAQYKVDKKEFAESPFSINDVIKCGFKGKEKMRKVDDKFVRTGEFESVLTIWNNMGENNA